MTVTEAVREEIRTILRERPEDTGAVLHRTALKAAVDRQRADGIDPLLADRVTLTPSAVEIFRSCLSELWTAEGEVWQELEEEAHRAAIARMDAAQLVHDRYHRVVGGPFPRRRHFPPRVLARYPLTQPAGACRRCGLSVEGSLELDHMMELVLGGPDHPHNLVRLCHGCHRTKPFIQLPTLAECRLAVLAWIADYPATWDDPQ